MIQVTKDELKIGDILAKSVYRANGDLLLRTGFEVNEKVLPKLKDLNYPTFWIEEEGTESIIHEDVLDLQVQLQSRAAVTANIKIVEDIKTTRKLTIDNIRHEMDREGQFKNIIMPEAIKESVKNIMIAISNKKEAVMNMNSLRTKDDYLFQHALDVTATAIFLGNKIQLPSLDIEEMALGCMLKDIGMVVIPDEIIHKKEKLTDEENRIFKEHTTFGYSILKENRGLPLTSAHVALQHHEQQNGGGYPRGLTGTNELPGKNTPYKKNTIHRYAEITAVADAYISLISPEPGKAEPLSPGDAIKSLIKLAGTHLNKALLRELILSIPSYPVGSRVQVVKDDAKGREGHIGIVTEYHPDNNTRPTIMILFDKNRRKIEPQTIDLREEAGMEIKFQVLNRPNGP